MKKKILMGILGLVVLGVSINVNAEPYESVEGDNNSTSSPVAVGDVDIPVYSVNIFWEDMNFDWIYDEEQKEYKWLNTSECEPLSNYSFLTSTNFQNFVDRLYNDSSCGINISDDTTYEEVSSNVSNYYYNPGNISESVSITIVDTSDKGSIIPEIEWSSEEEYDWTVGNFSYMSSICKMHETEEHFSGLNVYTNPDCTGGVVGSSVAFEEGKYYGWIHEEVPLTTKEVPIDAINRDPYYVGGDYIIKFSLDIDKTKEIQPPKSGDTIGTITITIKAAE